MTDLPAEEPWSPIGKSLAEVQADPERLRAWEKADKARELRLWNELNAELREDAAAQARFNQKVKTTLAVLALIVASVVLILRGLS